MASRSHRKTQIEIYFLENLKIQLKTCDTDIFTLYLEALKTLNLGPLRVNPPRYDAP